jgi:glutamyl-tRNA reductase
VSILVVGLSHRTAPLALLEAATLDDAAARALERRLVASGQLAEAMVLSTCNRLEVYAAADKFHPGVIEIGRALADVTGQDIAELSEHLYVHYEGAAVGHVFEVAAGLDSMAVGEPQILGQVRSTLRDARQGGNVGSELERLLQSALRVGKRAHADTGLDRMGTDLVRAGLDLARSAVGDLEGLRAVVVGAGAMSGLTVATLHRAGVDDIVVVNRTDERARRLAESVGGSAVPWSRLESALGQADVVISSTGAVGHVIDAEVVLRAREERTARVAVAGRPQVYLDLGMPRDVDPLAATVPGVVLIDLDELGRHLSTAGLNAGLSAARAIVSDEAIAYLVQQQEHSVGPTVAALRAQAAAVVDAELVRLEARLGEVDERVRDELARTVHRVVEKLLHTPTVRVKQLASGPDGASYTAALRMLFDLDPDDVEAVTELPGSSTTGGGVW